MNYEHQMDRVVKENMFIKFSTFKQVHCSLYHTTLAVCGQAGHLETIQTTMDLNTRFPCKFYIASGNTHHRQNKNRSLNINYVRKGN